MEIVANPFYWAFLLSIGPQGGNSGGLLAAAGFLFLLLLLLGAGEVSDSLRERRYRRSKDGKR